MKQTCCGADRSTPFCPMCGTKLSDIPLFGLLAYCLKRLKVVEREARPRPNQSIDPAYAKQLQDKVVTWRSWIGSITDLMAESAVMEEIIARQEAEK